MADLWSGFEHDPRDPAYAPVRASDRDRDVILHALGDAYAEGRLNREEYDERSDQVAEARTLGELPLLLADLVPTTALQARNAFVPAASDLQQRAADKYRKDRQEAWGAFIVPSAICWVIWLATNWGEGFDWIPWPLWVMLGTGINLVRVLAQRQMIIDNETRRLEKKAESAAERAAEKARPKELEPPPNDAS
jgi:hypothetical protein